MLRSCSASLDLSTSILDLPLIHGHGSHGRARMALRGASMVWVLAAAGVSTKIWARRKVKHMAHFASSMVGKLEIMLLMPSIHGVATQPEGALTS